MITPGEARAQDISYAVREPVALSRAFFEGSADEVAENLIETSIFVAGVGWMLAKTEAHDEDDPASHCSDRVMTALDESVSWRVEK